MNDKLLADIAARLAEVAASNPASAERIHEYLVA